MSNYAYTPKTIVPYNPEEDLWSRLWEMSRPISLSVLKLIINMSMETAHRHPTKNWIADLRHHLENIFLILKSSTVNPEGIELKELLCSAADSPTATMHLVDELVAGCPWLYKAEPDLMRLYAFFDLVMWDLCGKIRLAVTHTELQQNISGVLSTYHLEVE
jgi:hypothetical protein